MRLSKAMLTAGRGLLPVWLLLFTLVPLLMVLAVSLLTRDETGFITPEVTLENYRRLFDPVYLKVFTDSMAMAGLATLLCLGLAYPFITAPGPCNHAYSCSSLCTWAAEP